MRRDDDGGIDSATCALRTAPFRNTYVYNCNAVPILRCTRGMLLVNEDGPAAAAERDETRVRSADALAPRLGANSCDARSAAVRTSR